MKPLKLEFQAFGPYKGHEVINFAQLESDKLFLICGETGSGKTMILDAITHALYGKSTIDIRTDLESLRCNQADFNTDTFVKFTFENNGTTYLFERNLIRKKTNLSKERNVFIIDENGNKNQVFENCRENDINKYAEEIIGLNREQFRQVIILPQGKFETFLTATSDEKQKILSNIFKTEKWDEYAAVYYKNADDKLNELKNINEKIKNKISIYECETVEDFNARLESQKGRLKKLEGEYQKQNFDVQKDRIENQKLLLRKYTDLENTQGELDEHSAKETKIKDLQKSLDNVKKANNVKSYIKDFEDSKKAVDSRKDNLTKLTEEKLPKCESAFKEIEAKLNEHIKNQSECEKNKTRVITLKQKESIYEDIDKAKEKVDLLEKKLTEAKNKLNKSDELKDNAKIKYESKDKKHDELKDRYDNMFSLYKASISGELAEGLNDGEPCPVCGAVHHPHKAIKGENSVSTDELDEAKSKVDDAYNDMREAETESKKASEKAAEQKSIFTKIETDFNNAKSEYEKMLSAKEDGIETLAALKNEIEKCNKFVKQYNQRGTDLTNQKEEANNALNSCKTKIESAENELDAAEEKRNSSKKLLDEKLNEAGFKDIEEAKSCIKTSDEQEKIQQTISDYKAEGKTLTEKISALKKDIENTEKPNLSLLKEKLNEIKNCEKEYIEEIGKLKQKIDGMSEISKTIQKDSEYYNNNFSQADEDVKFAKELRGDASFGLQRYVLAIMFNKIISEANEMLKHVHNGRYHLFRTNDKTGSKQKHGLDLKVYDSYNPNDKEGRSVAMLSGGEKFLVSLSLAIGMSTVAQKSGVKIEAMFIDEGFGTLDESSIEDALDILQSVQKSNGIVGIISHVQILQENINKKIVVNKSKTGSTIKVAF